MTIYVDVDTRRVEDKLGRMLRKIPQISDDTARQIAEVYAKRIHAEASHVFSYPRRSQGMLRRGAIRAARVKRDAKDSVWGVAMPTYGIIVDKGRSPGRAPPDSPVIRKWASAAGINTWWLRRSIARHGTRPRKFIYPAILKAKSDVRKIIKTGLKKMAVV